MGISRRAVLALAPAVVFVRPPAASTPWRPVIVVHGSAGSAPQFRLLGRRLTANGCPSALIEAHEYDSSTADTSSAAIWAGLDARIDRLRTAAGTDRVDLIAHSLGTSVVQGYLTSDRARAARVAHYVSLDGRPASARPGGVPTLAVWGAGDPDRAVAGAKNVRLAHRFSTQTVSSVESFTEIFQFLRGGRPSTTKAPIAQAAAFSARSIAL